MVLFLVILLLMSEWTHQTNLTEECPDPEHIPYCMCEKRAPFGVTVDCHKFPEVEPLKDHLREMFNYSIGTFHLYFPGFTEAPSDLFENTSISTLMIAECNFTHLSAENDSSKSFLDGLQSSMEHLDIFYCPDFEDWNWSLLSKMKVLSSIHISACPVSTINKSVSEIGQGQLRTITFFGTKTQSIEEGSFQTHENLTAVNLRDNDLIEIHRNVFPRPAKHLKYIGLCGNNLTSLPDDIFMDMPALKELELFSNNFATLPENAIKPIWKNLRTLYIGGSNPFHCDCKMAWLLKAIKEYSPPFNDFPTAVCSSPTEHLGKKITDITIEDLNCT